MSPRTRIPFLALALFLAGIPARSQQPTDPGPVDASSREAVRQHYQLHMASPDPVPLSYTGDPANGIAGDITADQRAAYLHRINAFRRQAGIAPILLVDNSRNADWQAGAMMCAANGAISHYPPTSWRFYSAGGAFALETSNLTIGHPALAASVGGFIWDGGANNARVGHRWWFLGPDAGSVRIGAAIVPTGVTWAGSWAVVVGFPGDDGLGTVLKPRVAAWPAAGHFPKSAIPGRWSWHWYPDGRQPVGRTVNVSQATVSVTRNGVPLPVNVIYRGADWWLRGLSWTLDGTSEGEPARTGPSDEIYDVTIAGLIFEPNNSSVSAQVPTLTRSISYRVIGIDTEASGDARVAPPAFAPVLLSAASSAYGDTATVFAAARGATSYTWRRNGVPIPGSTSDRLSVRIMPDTIGEYSVTAHSAYGQTDGFISAGVYSSRPMPPLPSIVSQSTSRSVLVGEAVELLVFGYVPSPYPEAVPAYQWYKGGVAIPGATASKLSLPSPTLGDSGTYTCVVSNVAGSVTSAPIQLTVQHASPPVFTAQPGDRTVTERDAVSLSVTTASLVPVTYQWRKDGVPIPGATSATLFWANIPLDAAGTYTCVATSSAGSTTSSSIRLTVQKIPAPTFTRQPADTSVTEASLVTLSVATNSSLPVTYQWFKDGVAIPGAILTSISWSRITPADAGTYTCVATSTAGSTTSSPARLTVQRVPAPTITRQPVDKSVAEGVSVWFDIAASSAIPVTYQWYKDGVAIPGATSSIIVLDKVTAATSGTYTCVATNSNGSATSSPARLTVQKVSAPAFTAQPTSISTTPGVPIGFSVMVSGFPIPTYQWYKDGVAIPGATGLSHVIAVSTESDAGTYTCVATNSAGSATSTPATLSFGPTAWLSNVSVRTSLDPYQVVIVGLTVQGGSKDVLVRAAGPALGTFGVPGVMADPLIELYSGSTKVGTNDNWPSSLGSRFAQVGAFGFPAESKDAALLQALSGGYTVQVSGVGGGVVLVEGYDAGSGSTPRLINLSARNRSGIGADVLIAGFNVAGSGTQRVLIRGVGPGLAAFGVPGVLADPILKVFDSDSRVIAENDTWDPSLEATFRSVGAFGLPAGSKDAALLLTLPAGKSYTVQVSGPNSSTGEAIIEVYEVR